MSDTPRARTNVNLRTGGITLLVLVALVAWLAAGATRSIEVDESRSLLVTSTGPRPDWPDDVTTATDLAAPLRGSNGPVVAMRLAAESEPHPPLYYGVLATWRLVAGDSIAAARLLSALLMAVAAVLLLLALSRAGFGLWAGVAIVLFVLGPGTIHNAANARPYALPMVFVCAALLASVSRWRLLEGVLAGLAFVSHFLTPAVTAPLLAIDVWRDWRRERNWRVVVRPAIGVLPFVAGGIVLVAIQHHTTTPAPGDPPGWLALLPHNVWNMLRVVSGVFLQLTTDAERRMELSLLTLTGVLVLIVPVAIGAWKTRRELPAAVVVVATPLLVFAAIASTGHQLPHARYVWFAAPFLVMLAVAGLRTLPRAAAGLLLGMLVVGQLLSAAELAVMQSRSDRWREIAGVAQQMSASPSGQHRGTLALIERGSGRVTPACTAYELAAIDPAFPVRVISAADTVSALTQTVAPYRRIVLILGLQPELPSRQRLEELLAHLGRTGRWQTAGQLAGKLLILEQPALAQ